MKREVIAFVGRQGSGKSYQAKKLVKERAFRKVSFADPLRDIAFNVIGMDFETGMQQYDQLKLTPLINGLNFRNILENLGASVRRYDINFWARAMVKTIGDITDDVVIDDMRYPNEYEIVRTFCATKGIDFRAYYCDYKSDIYVADNKHESAGMSNYLAQLGYEDLQLINKKDVFGYSVLINDDSFMDTITPTSATAKVDIQKEGTQVLNMLKGLTK